MVSNLKNFAKQTINKKNMKTMGWDEIFENHISDKGLISKTYKELIQYQKQKQTNKKQYTHKHTCMVFPDASVVRNLPAM